MIRSLFAAFAIAVLPTVDDYPKNPHIDIERYVFDLTLNDANDSLAASATIVAKFLADGITTLRLDLINSMAKGLAKQLPTHSLIRQATLSLQLNLTLTSI